MSVNDDGLDELIAGADAEAVPLPTAAEVKARAKRAADGARAAMGSSKPVHSGETRNPRLRVLEKRVENTLASDDEDPLP